MQGQKKIKKLRKGLKQNKPRNLIAGLIIALCLIAIVHAMVLSAAELTKENQVAHAYSRAK